MKFKDFIKDKIVVIILYFLFLLFLILFLLALKIDISIIVVQLLFYIIFSVGVFLYEYFRKRNFYQHLKIQLDALDQKYLITELLTTPDFLEGKILVEILYEATKSMNEHINQYKYQLEDFKEYIELWVHEVKVPISSSLLMMHNSKTNKTQKIENQIHNIDYYVEQVLYYVRSENSEKDYLIHNCSLKEIVNKVIVRNKEDFILKHIKLETNNLDVQVLSDVKWLEYIINQIVVNSIKYSITSPAMIKIYTTTSNKMTILSIEDLGIGISKNDLPRIFEKGFTGMNGRKISSSTGMGLYICKQLCEKLGHKLEVVSEEGKGTTVRLYFYAQEFYDVVR